MESVIRITGVNSVTREREREKELVDRGVSLTLARIGEIKTVNRFHPPRNESHVFLLKKREREGTNAMKSEYYEA